MHWCPRLGRGVCFVLTLLLLALAFLFPTLEASESLQSPSQSHPSYSPWGRGSSPDDSGPLRAPPDRDDTISMNPAPPYSQPFNERTGPSSSAESSLAVAPLPTLMSGSHPTRILSKGATLVLLAFLAGISDYLCFQRLQFFVIMQTGNFIHALSSFVEGRWREAINFGVIVSAYAIGSGLWRVLNLTLSSSSAVAVASILALPFFHRCDAHPFSAPVILSLAFGLVSSAATTVGEGNISFAYTGHVSNAGKYFVERVLLRGRSFKRTPAASLRLLLGFASGVLSSALCHQSVSHSMAGGVPNKHLSNFVRHPFLVLGIAYAIVLCLGGVDLYSSSTPTSKESSDAYGASKNTSKGRLEELISTKLKMSVKGKRRRKGNELDIRIDGWTNMHAGPRGFKDGS